MTARASRLVASVLACLASAGGVAFAASLTVSSEKLTAWSGPAGCAPGAITVGADADSYIDQDNASQNFGNSSSLVVRAPLSVLGVDVGGRARALVRFELPDIGLCSVTAATLRLHATASAAGRSLQVVRITSAWSETGVTWSNQPATDTSVVTATSGTGWVSWTVTSQVQSMYSGTNNGFLVRDPSILTLAAQQTYNSRTAASNRPELIVTYG